MALAVAVKLLFARASWKLGNDIPGGPVRAFAEHQPVTSIVDAIRSLLAGQPVEADIWAALGWCVGILLVAWFFAERAFRRTTA